MSVTRVLLSDECFAIRNKINFVEHHPKVGCFNVSCMCWVYRILGNHSTGNKNAFVCRCSYMFPQFTPFLVSFNAFKSCYFQRNNVTITLHDNRTHTHTDTNYTQAHSKHKAKIFSVHCVRLLNVYRMFWTRSQWVWLMANFWLRIRFPVSHVSHVFFCAEWHPLVDSLANVHKNTNICCKLHAISFTGWCCLLFDSCVFFV